MHDGIRRVRARHPMHVRINVFEVIMRGICSHVPSSEMSSHHLMFHLV